MIYPIKKAEFITSATNPRQYPKTSVPEIAFSGRSNVGKSSLINALLNRKKLVKTSATPGRTQLLNFFQVNDDLIFVDLPGYGYAKVPRSLQKKWGTMVETYLQSRSQLLLVIVILDIRRDPGPEDMDLIHWLKAHDLSFKIVLTKCDKISKNMRAQRIAKISQKLNQPSSDILIFSSHTHEGREKFWEEILRIIGITS